MPGRIEQAPHRLVGDPGDHVIVAVDVQHLGSVQFGSRGDDQVQARGTYVARLDAATRWAAGRCGLGLYA